MKNRRNHRSCSVGFVYSKCDEMPKFILPVMALQKFCKTKHTTIS